MMPYYNKERKNTLFIQPRANYGVSSGGKLILLLIFGVVTTHPLQECCANYSLSSDAMLILFCNFAHYETEQ